MKLTNYQKTKIMEYCAGFSAQLYADFLDPKNQGEKFTWEDFPDMVSRLCRVNLFMVFSQNVYNSKEAEDYAYLMGGRIAKIMAEKVKK